MLVTSENIAARIKRLREARGLTKYRLAKLSGIDVAYMVQLESGKVDQPRRSTLEMLAKGLGVSPSIFFSPDYESLEDTDIKDFLVKDFPSLDSESKDWVRRTINMVRERQKDKYQAEKKEGE
jgi:transcriptional regulator with XRE-family HTH domain